MRMHVFESDLAGRTMAPEELASNSKYHSGLSVTRSTGAIKTSNTLLGRNRMQNTVSLAMHFGAEVFRECHSHPLNDYYASHIFPCWRDSKMENICLETL